MAFERKDTNTIVTLHSSGEELSVEVVDVGTTGRTTLLSALPIRQSNFRVLKMEEPK